MSSRVAIVTGSAQGIGKAIALRLAKDGLNVVVSDIASKRTLMQEVVREIEALGRKGLAVPCDVSVDKQVQELVDTAVEKLGGLDVMVANAGVAPLAQLLDLDEKQWDFVQSINVKGVFFCYKYAAAQMIKQGRGGRIIGASSVSGKMGGVASSAYSASKFAIRGLSQSAAAELVAHKITVNTYAPGTIQTPMFDGCAQSLADQGLERQSEMLKMSPKGSPDDVAALVSFLVSPESQFITGQSVNINGGIRFD